MASHDFDVLWVETVGCVGWESGDFDMLGVETRCGLGQITLASSWIDLLYSGVFRLSLCILAPCVVLTVQQVCGLLAVLYLCFVLLYFYSALC